MKVDGSSPSKIGLSDFFDHFKHLFSDGNSFTADHVEQFINQKFNENSTSTDTDQPYDTSLLDAQITSHEVKNAIFKLKRNKSPGLDLLPSELFIDTSDLLSEPLCKLFNYIFYK